MRTLAGRTLADGTEERLTEIDNYEEIDEMVMRNANVHLERLDDRCYMLIAENDRFHWHLKIHVAKTQRGVICAFAYEMEDREADS